jgi:hypothetical protein
MQMRVAFEINGDEMKNLVLVALLVIWATPAIAGKLDNITQTAEYWGQSIGVMYACSPADMNGTVRGTEAMIRASLQEIGLQEGLSTIELMSIDVAFTLDKELRIVELKAAGGIPSCDGAAALFGKGSAWLK